MWISRAEYNNLLDNVRSLREEVFKLKYQNIMLGKRQDDKCDKKDFTVLMQHLKLHIVVEPEKLVIRSTEPYSL